MASLGLCGAFQLRFTWWLAESPVPLRTTVEVLPVDELLAMVNWPLTAPVAVGSNSTLSEMETPGLRVTGNVAPANRKPEPEIEAEITVTGCEPVEERVTV